MYTQETATGWQAVIPNRVLGVSQVFDTDTKEQAQEIIDIHRAELDDFLASCETIGRVRFSGRNRA